VWTVTELRDRIAAILSSKEVVLDGDYINRECAWLLADAVIEALDLRIEDKYKTASGQKQLFGVSGFFEVEVDGD
jgi:hypothetical protein